MDTLRRVFAALSARFEPGVLWRAGDLDRLLDEDHAGIMEAAAAVYRADSWEVFPEVSFSRFGERGSIDLLSLYPSRRVAVINEVKASINSVEETHRRQDVKVRLCSDIVQERFGWRPSDFPHAARVGQQTISLPLSAKLTDADVQDVIAAVRDTLGV